MSGVQFEMQSAYLHTTTLFTAVIICTPAKQVEEWDSWMMITDGRKGPGTTSSIGEW